MPKSKTQHHLVVALIYNNLCTFELGLTTEIFGLSRPEIEGPWYDFATVSETDEPVCANGGLSVQAEKGLGTLVEADTIIVPGWKTEESQPSEKLVAAMLRAHARGARVVSICSGAFLLAELGLLDNRQATTHWRYTKQLQTLYPSIDVKPDVLFVDNDDVLTSAGSAAGIDLLLHIVRKDFGPVIANTVARRLVMSPHRQGGQKQFIESPIPKYSNNKISELLEFIRLDLKRKWSLTDMASYCAVSPRTFSRKFRSFTGKSPGDWLSQERVNSARILLELHGMPMGDIAFTCGLGTSENLSRQFKKRFAVSPSQYRTAFSEQA